MTDILISVRFHHGGKFRYNGELKYFGGQTKVYERVNIGFFGWFDVKKMIADLGYREVSRIQWLLPGRGVGEGLRVLKNDRDCQQEMRSSMEGDILDIYLEGCIPFDSNVALPLESSYLRDVYLEGVSILSIYNEEIDFLSSGESDDLQLMDSDDDDHELIEVRNNLRRSRETISVDDEHIEELPHEMCENDIVDSSSDDLHYDSSIGSQYIDSSDPGSYLGSDEYSSDDDEDAIRWRRSSCRRYDPRSICPRWSLGMFFTNAQDFKDAVMKYAAAKGVQLQFKKNEPNRVRVVCRPTCPWLLYASSTPGDKLFRIKTYIPEHRCYKENKLKIITSSHIAKLYRFRILEQPNIKLRVLKELCREELKVNVTIGKCRRAKMIVLEQLEGLFKSQYVRLYDYAEELRLSNPGSTVAVGICREEIDGNEILTFKNFYVCFDSLKKGWKAGCRPVIGIDGCFLKKIGNCQLLSAIGRDGNNQMFPIAWAVVLIESKETWQWFLRLLMVDIGSTNGKGLTIISDMQKGLVPAVEEVMPLAEHRHCANHIYSSWSKKWRGDKFRLHFWSCVRSTYEQQFTKRLASLDRLGKGAVSDVIRINSSRWCKAFFSTHPKCDITCNNLTETFNAWILEARCKPIINMLDHIRVMVMNRLHVKKRSINEWISDISPRAMTRLEKAKVGSCQYRVDCNADQEYEVVKGNDRHTVHIGNQTCTCRLWDLSGIPCMHAVCAINHAEKNPEDFVSKYYKKEAYLNTYKFFLQPVKGMNLWLDTGLGPIEPPQMIAKRGRQNKAKRKDMDEPKKYERMSSSGRKMSSSIYRPNDHNKQCCLKKPREENTSKQSRTNQSKERVTVTEDTQENNSKTTSEQSRSKRRKEETTVT